MTQMVAGGVAEGMPVGLAPDRGGDEQRWYLDRDDSRQTRIRHAATGLCLTADDLSTGARLRLRPARGEDEEGCGLQWWTPREGLYEDYPDYVRRCHVLHLGSGSEIALMGRDLILAADSKGAAVRAWAPLVNDPKLDDASWTAPAIGWELSEGACQAKAVRDTPVLWQVTGQGSGGWRMDAASTTSGEVLEEHVFPAGIGFTAVDQNKPVRGWFTAHGRGWLPAQPDAAGATLKTFYRAGARSRAGFVDADALTDLAPADFDAEVVTTTARRWRADVRAYGLPDLSRTQWVVTWNEIDGLLHSDLDGHFVQGHGLKLTGQAARGKYTLRKLGAQQKWSAGQTRKTFYETTDDSGGTMYWVDGDDIVLRSS
ncbi:hypothetical protein [Streptomyces sp. NPDC048357]|uniref:RICIN domain-containing protein n=1 Tax=Streptomyces sp. NPDC048357 TaxID=3154719 RepID=UPI00343E305E